MAVLMEDAYKLLKPATHVAVCEGWLYDLLYADDTLLMGVRAGHVSELAAAVERVVMRFRCIWVVS